MSQHDYLNDILNGLMTALEAQMPPGTGVVLIVQPANDPNHTRLLHNSDDDRVAGLLRLLGDMQSEQRGSTSSRPTLQ